MSAHKFMSHVAAYYNIKSGAIRMQFIRKGYYKSKNIHVKRVELL